MRNQSASKTVPGLLLLLLTTLVLTPPAAALDADYWRGGWRTPLGDEPHIYQFVIRGSRVTGVYCRNCSDATTIGFIDGTWDEKAGIDFKVYSIDGQGNTCTLNAAGRTPVTAEGAVCVTTWDTRAKATKDGVKSDNKLEAECRATWDEVRAKESSR